MQVNVRIFGKIALSIGKQHTFELIEDTDIIALTNKIADKASQSRGYLGEFRVGSNELAIMINGKNIVTLDGLNTALKHGDLVVIMPSVFGG